MSILSDFGRKAPGKSRILSRQITWVKSRDICLPDGSPHIPATHPDELTGGNKCQSNRVLDYIFKCRKQLQCDVRGSWSLAWGSAVQIGTLFSLAHFFMILMIYSTWVFPVLLSKCSTSRRVSLGKGFERHCLNRGELAVSHCYTVSE